MKEKWLTYLLIPVVATIWGFAIYRYFFETPEGIRNVPDPITHLADDDTNLIAQQDTYQLHGDYRDPFLSRLYVSDDIRQQSSLEAPSKPITDSPKPQTPPPPSIDWRIYKYYGLVQQSGTESQLGILNIKGKAHYVKPSDVLGELSVIALAADSIQIQLGKEKQTIKRH